MGGISHNLQNLELGTPSLPHSEAKGKQASCYCSVSEQGRRHLLSEGCSCVCVCVFSRITDECSAVLRGLQGRPEDLTQVYILLGRRSDVNELHKKVPGWLLSPPP